MRKRMFITLLAGFAVSVLLTLVGYASDLNICGPDLNRSSWVYYDDNGKLQYKSLNTYGDKIMDFSTAGYKQGTVAIPTAPPIITLSPSCAEPCPCGDDTKQIQNAIDELSRKEPLNSDGLRGAVRLAPGCYTVTGTLTIDTSGVVLQGSGVSADRGTVIYFGQSYHDKGLPNNVPFVMLGTSNDPKLSKSKINITDDYVPAGTLTLTLGVSNAAGLEGKHVMITKPVTPEWVNLMKMDDSGCPGGDPCWIPYFSDWLQTDRNIVAVQGNQVTLDAPMSDSIDSTYSPLPYLQTYSFPERISQVGVENLRVIAPQPPPCLEPDKDHVYQLVVTHSVIDAWARNLTAQDTLQSVDIGNYSKQVTVSNVAITHTVDQKGDAKFEEFWIAGATQVLMEHVEDTALNTFFFSTSTATQGPNVLRYGKFYGDASVEPHQRWATGLLVEDTTVERRSGPNPPTKKCTGRVPSQEVAAIDFWNRGAWGTGHGWTIGWGVVWNSKAEEFYIQKPPGSENWCIGCLGEQKKSQPPPFNFPTFPIEPQAIEPQGVIDSPNTCVSPLSLYLAQLCERVPEAPECTGATEGEPMP